jgi:ABC-type dipeptide/oligopeptide/nickel transport system ATPase subunit
VGVKARSTAVVQLIFQDPYETLNLSTHDRQFVAEPLVVNNIGRPQGARRSWSPRSSSAMRRPRTSPAAIPTSCRAGNGSAS